MLKRLPQGFLFPLFALVLSACVSQAPQTIPVEVENRPSPPEVLTPEVRPSSPVVQRMLDDAEAHFAAGRVDQAMASAERGLRIDRRSPQLYLVLARCYQQQSDTTQARQFAEQGLRYVVDRESEVALELQDLLAQLQYSVR